MSLSQPASVPLQGRAIPALLFLLEACLLLHFHGETEKRHRLEELK